MSILYKSPDYNEDEDKGFAIEQDGSELWVVRPVDGGRYQVSVSVSEVLSALKEAGVLDEALSKI